MLARRLRSRLQGERGFTIVETMVAITVIFSSLTALAYTVTAGLRYVALGRARIEATATANHIMEDIRGLPYDSVTGGLKTSDVVAEAGDANGHIVGCSGTYKLDSCTGDPLVSTAFAIGYTAEWLVPHEGTVSGRAADFHWSTYVTKRPATASDSFPYVVTVIVTWSGGASGPGNVVRLQSQFWSPQGCLGTDTHPFAAPCNPFFYGVASVTPATITVNPTFAWHTVNLAEALLHFPGVEVNGQEEQVAEFSGSVTAPYLETTVGATTTPTGQQTASALVDNDPTTGTTTVGGATGTGAGADVGVYQTDPDPPGQIGMQTTMAGSNTLAIAASTAARSTDVTACLPWGTRQNDRLGCLGASAEQGGTMRIRLPFNHAIPVGEADLIRVLTPSAGATPSTYASIDRIAGGVDQDGMIQAQAARRFGTIYLGGYPSSGLPVTNRPAGLVTTLGDPANYCYRITGYTGSVTALAGEGSTALTAPSVTGTIEYLSAGVWQPIDVKSVSLGSLGGCTQTSFIGTQPFKWSVQAQILKVAASPSASITTLPSDSSVRTKVETSSIGLRLKLTYTFEYDDLDEVNIVSFLDMGSGFARSIYGPPPSG